MNAFLLRVLVLLFVFANLKAVNAQQKFSSAGFYEVENSQRKVYNFNVGWRFQKGNIDNVEKVGFNDSKWRTLNLPHDWSVEYDFNKENSGRNAWLPSGIGWYRKTFTLPEQYKNKHIEIQFDGVYRHSQIWVNGEHVGAQYDGYTSFYFDISPYLVFDKENVIAVKVDNSVQPNCRWYTGSGIYRNTWLRISDPLHIKTWGTYITTPKVSKKEAIVNIKTTIQNVGENVNAVLSTTVLDEEGKIVLEKSTNFKANLRKDYNLEQDFVLSNPKLWSVNSPYLYSVLSKIIVEGKVIDDYKSTFGIRTIVFDAKKGFFLNDDNIKIKGVCLHHEAGVLGAAVPIEIWESRLKTLKEIGCNAIRTAHNPTSPDFMDLCDKMGFLVMDEFVDKWYDNVPYANSNLKSNFFNPNGFGDPNFYLEWKKNYKNTVFRDRNHPSVIIWSVGNENHSPGDVRQIAGLRKYTSFVRTLDPTRPVISGMERGRDGVPTKKVDAIIKTSKEMDLIAMNYGEQWCKAIGDKNPGKPFVSTESYTYFNSTPEKRFANIERSPWLDVLDNDHNMGLFLWVGFDYLGESRKFPKLGSDSGLMDIAGFRNEVSYLYEAFWSEKPMVRIAVYNGDADDFSTSGRWGSPPMKANWNLEEGKAYDLVTYTNCESVNLYLNGKKIGNKKLKDFSNWIMKWRKIPFQKGTIKAVGVINGKEICEFELNTTGNANKISLKTSKTSISKGEVIQVEVNILDRKGELINHEETNLRFELENGGKILGLSNGDINDTTPFSNKTARKTKAGKCLVIIKAGNDLGKMKLKVSSENLKTQILNLNIN